MLVSGSLRDARDPSKPLALGLVLQPRMESGKAPAAWPSALGCGAGISVLQDRPLGLDAWQGCVQKS